MQIDRYVDSISASISTSAALSDLNAEKTEQQISALQNGDVGISSENDVINNPAVRLVDSIIKEAIPYRASDIHIEPFEKEVKVRYRIDGDLQNRAEFPIEAYSAICARLKIMSGLKSSSRRAGEISRPSCEAWTVSSDAAGETTFPEGTTAWLEIVILPAPSILKLYAAALHKASCISL